MARYEAELLVFIDAASQEEAYDLALEAARQVDLRLGTGPHSIAPYLPVGKAPGKARVVEAELVLCNQVR